MNCNLYGVEGSFDLRVENQRIKLDTMFLGASTSKLSHGLFLKWTRLQRFFFMLPKHFLHVVGFETGGGLFLRLSKFFL